MERGRGGGPRDRRKGLAGWLRSWIPSRKIRKVLAAMTLNTSCCSGRRKYPRLGVAEMLAQDILHHSLYEHDSSCLMSPGGRAGGGGADGRRIEVFCRLPTQIDCAVLVAQSESHCLQHQSNDTYTYCLEEATPSSCITARNKKRE